MVKDPGEPLVIQNQGGPGHAFVSVLVAVIDKVSHDLSYLNFMVFSDLRNGWLV
jgi:hypothetical protein